MTGNKPLWWQRRIPRYGNWGGVGWSAGRWNNDPILTDWSVPARDAMDWAFKRHDWAYQHGLDLDVADCRLVRELSGIRQVALYGKFYRMLAMTVFTVWPLLRSKGDFLQRRMTMKQIAFVLLALVALAFCALPAFAGAGAMFAVDVVPGITPLDFPAQASSPEAHWIWALLGSSAFAAIVAALGKIVQSIIANIQDARIAKACDFVYAGTMACYQEYVRMAKAANADGKLTLEEKNEALQYAYHKAIDIARSQGFDLLKVFAKETILALIEKYVGQSKIPAAVKAAVAPLADLPPSAPSV